jgi:hypothetical protein
MPQADDVNAFYGNRLLNSLLYGTAAGAGGMGLWHLLKGVKTQKEKARAAKPNLEDVAAAPPSFMLPKQANDGSNLYAAMPLAGAGIGALIGAVRAEKGKRFQKALDHAAIGGLAGGGLGVLGHYLNNNPSALSPGRQISEAVGAAVPSGASLGSALGGEGGEAVPTPKTPIYGAAVNVGVPLLAGLGVYGGAKGVNALVEKEDDEKNVDAVQSARDDYFKTLLGRNDEKTAFSQNLDTLYAAYEKRSMPEWLRPVGDWVAKNFVNNPEHGPHSRGDMVDTGLQFGVEYPLTIAGASALAGGLLGANHMYNKTRDASKAKMLMMAQKARERARGLDSPWVDPVELAHVKELATHQNM